MNKTDLTVRRNRSGSGKDFSLIGCLIEWLIKVVYNIIDKKFFLSNGERMTNRSLKNFMYSYYKCSNSESFLCIKRSRDIDH